MEFLGDHWRSRENDYRSAFFRKNRGILGRLWFCSQCWIPLLDKKNVEVDHIVAGSRLLFKGRDGKRNAAEFVLNKLLLGSENNNVLATLANTEMNTVAICSHCNKVKGNKLGMYVVKGWAAKVVSKIIHIVQDVAVFTLYFALLLVHYIVKLTKKGATKGGKSGFKFVAKMKYGKLGMLVVALVAIIILSTKYLR